MLTSSAQHLGLGDLQVLYKHPFTYSVLVGSQINKKYHYPSHMDRSTPVGNEFSTWELSDDLGTSKILLALKRLRYILSLTQLSYTLYFIILALEICIKIGSWIKRAIYILALVVPLTSYVTLGKPLSLSSMRTVQGYFEDQVIIIIK